MELLSLQCHFQNGGRVQRTLEAAYEGQAIQMQPMPVFILNQRKS